MHIAIEGMDGVGKTTAAIKLSQKLGFSFVEKPLHYLFDEKNPSFLENYMNITRQVNDECGDTFRAWFYTLGSLFLKEKFNNVNIVTDRHLVSNFYWNGNEKNRPIFELLFNYIGFPEHTFLLYARPEIRYERIYSRNRQDKDLNALNFNDEPYNKMLEFIRKYNMAYTVIDTSDLNSEEVIIEIMDIIYEKNIIEERKYA